MPVPCFRARDAKRARCARITASLFNGSVLTESNFVLLFSYRIDTLMRWQQKLFNPFELLFSGENHEQKL